MANSAQARKRTRQNERRRQVNMSMVVKCDKFKAFRSAVDAKDKAQATKPSALVKFFGRLIANNLMHKNKAARLTSQLNKQVKQLG